MAFLNTGSFSLSDYELYVYLTEDGKNAFYNGGFNGRATYFSLGCSDVNYSGDTSTNTTSLRGTVLDGSVSHANIGVDYDTIENKIVHYPDVQVSESLDLTSFTVDSNGQKLFNNSFTNHPYHPINLENTNASYEGVSVTDTSEDVTDYSKFYLMNKSSQSFYLDQIEFVSVDPPLSHFMTEQRTIIPETGDTAFIEYDIGWYSDLQTLALSSAYYEGTLTLKIPKLYFEFNERVSMFPFQIFPFEVKYEVIAPGSALAHYHGQTLVNSNFGGFGELRFTLRFTAIDQKRRIGDFQEISQEIGVICRVHDTGYHPNNYEEPQLIFN